MDQVQTQVTSQDRTWSDTALPGFAAEVERNFAFKGLAREFRIHIDVDNIVDLALAILVPALRLVISDWYANRGSALVDLLHPVDLQALDAWLVGDVRHWTAVWDKLDPARGGSAPATKTAVAELRQAIQGRPLPPGIAGAVARAVAGRDRSAKRP